jgi:hypothetical protein
MKGTHFTLIFAVFGFVSGATLPLFFTGTVKSGFRQGLQFVGFLCGMRRPYPVVIAPLALFLAGASYAHAQGDVSADLLQLNFLNAGLVGYSGDNLTLLTQCSGFSEDTVQVSSFGV